MNKDIRLSISFYRHIKRRKLEARLGPAAVLSFIDLLLYVGENKPDGILSGMDAEDIALAAQWTGDPEEFVAILLEINLLEKTHDEILAVHHWAEHNAYAAHAEERSERAKRAAGMRWGTSGGDGEQGAMTRGKSESQSTISDPTVRRGVLQYAPTKRRPEIICSRADSAVQDAQVSTAPSPAPSPSPDPSPSLPHPKLFNSQGFERFWAAYPRKVGKRAALHAWNRLKPSETFLAETLVPALVKQQRTRQWQNKGFIPHPATWLNQRRWEDEVDDDPASPEPTAASTGSPLYDAYLQGKLPVAPAKGQCLRRPGERGSPGPL